MGARLPFKYGDRFDDRIAAGVRAGKCIPEIARSIGISRSTTLRRAHMLGLSRKIFENVSALRSLGVQGNGNPRRRPQGNRQSKLGCAAIKAFGEMGHRDCEVSRLPHRIRAAKVPLSRHAIAALHERGLTLEELHHATGRPVADLVGFIREAAR